MLPFPIFGRSLERDFGYASSNPSFRDILDTLGFSVLFHFNEITGTVVQNYGTLGAALNGTWSPGAGALGQTGRLGLNEAYLYDGANSITTFPANAAINALQAATYLFLINPSSAGESNNARLFETNTDTELYTIHSVNLDLRMVVPGTGTLTTITNTGFISLSTWSLLFYTYAFSGDFKGRMYKNSGDNVVEATYATQTAGSGSKTGVAATKNVGNLGLLNRTFNGLIDEFGIAPYVLSVDQMTSIVKAVNQGYP